MNNVNRSHPFERKKVPILAIAALFILPVLEGKSKEHKKHSFAIQSSRGIKSGPESYGIRTVRSQRYRYVLNLSPEVDFRNTMMKSDWFRSWEAKASSGDARAAGLVKRFRQRPAVELYDANADPWNMKNLADDPKYAEKMQEMKAELVKYLNKLPGSFADLKLKS